MKINYKNILLVILGFLWLFMAMNILYSCSASYHFGKFIKKGGTIENKTEYVTTTDTIKINGKDSVINVRIPVTCPEVQIPPTRTEIRYKYKLQRDSIKTVRYVTKWKTKEVVKVSKSENKSNWLLFIVIGFTLGILTLIICKR